MGRRKHEGGVRELYVYDPDIGKSRCSIDNCKFTANGDHLGNLKKHLKKEHTRVYDEIERRESIYEYSIKSDEPACKKKKVIIEISEMEMKELCVKLVTKYDLPVNILDISPIRRLTDTIFTDLNMNPINSSNVFSIIESDEQKLREEIIKLCRKKLLSLKIDCVSKCGRSIVVINVQLIVDGEIVLKTLGLKEIKWPSTAETLKDFIVDILNRYEIQLNQIYSITSDNDHNFCSTTCSNDKAAEIDSDASNYDEIEIPTKIGNVSVIRCEAHNIQLPVYDVLKEKSVEEIVSKCKLLAQELRTQPKTIYLKANNLKIEGVDVKKGWKSIYDMLGTLYELKDVCDMNLQHSLNFLEWTLVENILNVLKPFETATSSLQNEHLCYGDFFKVWLELYLTIKQFHKEKLPLSQILCNSLENIKNNMLENIHLAAAMYLDPRFRQLFSTPEYIGKLQSARNHLLGIFRQILEIEKTPATSTDIDIKMENLEDSHSSLDLSEVNIKTEHSFGSTSNISSTSKEANPLEAYLNEICGYEQNESQEFNSDVEAIFKKINEYNDRCPPSTNVLSYWHSRRFLNPELKKLSSVVHSIPATQVSVQRTFPALKYISNENSRKFTPDVLEKILILRLNK